ncbi:putative pentatricopeptide repeat-containing protein [Tripterygium wilfordii]|nr:putative pentatricopeptide repeat-containing protein [Tripterygium wilfordii]
MLWQHNRSLFYATQIRKIFRSCSLRFTSSSPAMIPAPISDKTHKTHKHPPEYLGQDSYLLKEFKFTLTPEIVHSTLLNCPSDLIALSFFLWCAKRPNYFHDSQGFAHMVPVVTRLKSRYKSVKGILGQLYSVCCVIKAQTFLLLLEICWRGGMYDMVFEV